MHDKTFKGIQVIFISSFIHIIISNNLYLYEASVNKLKKSYAGKDSINGSQMRS